MNYKESCRTCLRVSKEMRYIHATISIAGSDVRLSNILSNFYGFQETTEDCMYPEKICINCVHQLIMTHSFKALIESSTKTLSDNVNCIESSDSYDCHFDTNYTPATTNKIKTYHPKELPKDYTTRTITKIKEPQKLIVKHSLEFKKRLFCVECKAEFHSSRSLNEHCAVNHPVKSTIGRDCEYCNEKFEDFKELVIHRKLHLRPYLCETCWSGFYTANDFEEHSCEPNQNKRSKSANEQVLCQCDQCGKSYPQGYIKVHMMTHGNVRRYSCKYCPKKFKVANGLNSHILWNHKRTRDHKCDECGALFISASARSSHFRKNHLKERKYACEKCAKRFFSKSELSRHMLTHTGVKNYHCHLCDKSYQTRYGLNVHLKSHAQMTMNVLNL